MHSEGYGVATCIMNVKQCVETVLIALKREDRDCTTQKRQTLECRLHMYK